VTRTLSHCLAAISESENELIFLEIALIETTKLNGVDSQAWLTDTLGRVSDHKITRLFA
jgi:hypothetical protein